MDSYKPARSRDRANFLSKFYCKWCYTHIPFSYNDTKDHDGLPKPDRVAQGGGSDDLMRPHSRSPKDKHTKCEKGQSSPGHTRCTRRTTAKFADCLHRQAGKGAGQHLKKVPHARDAAHRSGQPDSSGVTKLLFTRMWHRQTGLPAGTENAASPFPASPDVRELTRYLSCRNVITFLQEYGTLSAKKQNATALCFFARESLHLRMQTRYANTAENSRPSDGFMGLPPTRSSDASRWFQS